MIDLPQHKHERISHDGIISISIAGGNYMLSPKVEVFFQIRAYYNINGSTMSYDNSVRLWEFYHVEEGSCALIIDGVCTGCKKIFPDFESLVMSIRLQLFKDPSKLDIRYYDDRAPV